MLKRIAIYAGAFLLPPTFIGIYLAATALTTAMVIRNPEPVEGTPPSAWIPPSKKPVAVIVASNAGTQVTDLLGPYEILQASGLFRVIVAAPVRQLAPLTGAVSVLPDLSLADVPKPDLIFVPAISDPTNAAIVDWLKAKAPDARLVVGACEGARVLAQAGLLNAKRATSHVLAIKDLRKRWPDTEFVDGERVVVDGKVMTSAGITGAIDAAFAAVEAFSDPARANSLRVELGWNAPLPTQRPGPLQPWPFVRIALDSAYAGFDSARRWIGVLVYPGVSELSLAFAIDPFPRTMLSRVYTVSVRRALTRTRFGLHVVPTAAISQALPPDLLIVPSGLEPSGALPAMNPLSDPLIDSWVRSRNLSIKSWLNDKSASTLDRSLELIAALDGAQAARSTAQLMEYPRADFEGDHTRASRVYWAIAAFALLGLCGVWIARWLQQRLATRA